MLFDIGANLHKKKIPQSENISKTLNFSFMLTGGIRDNLQGRLRGFF